ERRVNRDMIHEVRQQEVEREKSARQKEIVHRVQIDAAHGGDHKHDKEEKQQRHRRKVTDPAGQRSRLELFRQNHADLKAGEQILRYPRQLPAVFCFLFQRRRQGVIWKVDIPKIGCQLQLKIAHLRHPLAELIAPTLQSLRTIFDGQNGGLTASDACPAAQRGFLVDQRQCSAIQSYGDFVVACLRRR